MKENVRTSRRYTLIIAVVCGAADSSTTVYTRLSSSDADYRHSVVEVLATICTWCMVRTIHATVLVYRLLRAVPNKQTKNHDS